MLKKRKPKKKKIVFISNSCWYLYNFRKKLIKDVIKENYEVDLDCPYGDGQSSKKIVNYLKEKIYGNSSS